MKEQILKALKNKYANLGFNEKALVQMADFLLGIVGTDEANIEPTVNGAEPLLKAFQSEIDRERTEKSKLTTQLEELKKKIVDPAKPATEGGAKPEPDDFQKTILETIQKLSAKIEGFESSNKQDALKGKLLNSLKAKEISEEYYKTAIEGRVFNDDAEVDSFVEKLDNGWKSLNQTLANKSLKNGVQPNIMGGANKDGVSQGVADYIESTTKKESAFSGKEL